MRQWLTNLVKSVLCVKSEPSPRWSFVVVPHDQRAVFSVEEPLLIVVDNVVEWDNGDAWVGPFSADEIETIVIGSHISEDTGEITHVRSGASVKKLQSALK